VGEVIGYMEEGAAAQGASAAPSTASAKPADASASKPATTSQPTAATTQAPVPPGAAPDAKVMPAARRELAEKGLQASEVAATGPGNRLLKEDVLREER